MSDDVNIEIDENEMNLEELILLGEDKKIPIKIEFPQGEKRVTAKALIKQLTLKEASSIQTKNKSDLEMSIFVLGKCLFKHDGEQYTKEELFLLPMGVVRAIAGKIMEVSGIDTGELRNF